MSDLLPACMMPDGAPPCEAFQDLQAMLSEARPVSYVQALGWAITTFGTVAAEQRERVLRFVEEALELAHAAGLEPSDLQRLTERIYGRPQGKLDLEIAQAGLTLGCLAAVAGVDIRAAEATEFARIQAIPKTEWKRRHSAKVLLGIAGTNNVNGI